MIKRVLFAVSLALVASIAPAVEGDKFDSQVASMVLLQNQAVQKELKITETQRNKLNVFAKKFNDAQKAYVEKVKKNTAPGKTPKRDETQELKMVMELKSQVLTILTNVQVRRLREISLQAIGVAALADETVATKVGLNPDQKKRIRATLESGLKQGEAISNAAIAKAREGIKAPVTQEEQKSAQVKFEKAMKVLGPPAQKKLNDVRVKTISNVLAIMSAPQRATWKTLLGTEFKG